MHADAPVLRLGVAGLGMAGSGILAAVARHPGFVVGGAATREPSRRAAFAAQYGVPCFSSVEELCQSDAVDVIYIATPTEFHAEHVLAAVAGGKHVIVEKPMAIRLEDAHRMVEAVAAAGVTLVVGHSHSFEPPIQAMRELIAGGRLGELGMIHSWYFNDWLYRPRTAQELDTAQGGGVTFRQGAHQFDIIRYLGGGLVRSVRAMTGRWDPSRPTEGAHVVYLEFENGVPATAVYSGYDHFWTAELTFSLGEWGEPLQLRWAASRRRLAEARAQGIPESALKRGQGFESAENPLSRPTPHHPFFGLTLVSLTGGDIRQSPDGLWLYTDGGKEEVVIPKEHTGRDRLLQELYDAVVHGVPPTHDAAWGRATLEVSLAVLQSARERREVFLRYQTPVPG